MGGELHFKINFYYKKITFKNYLFISNELTWERLKMVLFGALI